MKPVSPACSRPEPPARPVRQSPSPDYDVVVIGAGPYGLSAAAYLKAKGLGIRVFGEPMAFWADRMPEGMLLRSPRAASNLADPRSQWSLGAFEKALGRKAAAPVPLRTFVEYGRWFRQRLGDVVDPRPVAGVSREGAGFRLTLATGATLSSRRVVVAAGIGPFRRKPRVFDALPPQLASHCYEGRKIAELAGKRVVVVGAGQSALESAALLREAGSAVEVVAKIPALRWIGQHPWLHRLGPLSTLLYSKYDVGPAAISRLVANPGLVAHLPLRLKDKLRGRAVRPAGSTWLPARLTAVTLTTGRSVQAAEAVGGEVRLTLDDATERRADHVLMGTGYEADISRYDFLAPELLADVQRLGGYPALDSGFNSSVSGLHFIGATAARSFGPLLYFVAGTEFACSRLSARLAPARLHSLRP
jgi:cation diffusion facilitator CzcD-associated flavoprotein CzcO